MSNDTKHAPTLYRISRDEGDGHTYLVTDSDRWGQSSGVALLLRLMHHRPGSADRVPPDDIQKATLEYIVRAANTHAEAAAVIHDLSDALGKVDDYGTASGGEHPNKQNRALDAAAALLARMAGEAKSNDEQDENDAMGYCRHPISSLRDDDTCRDCDADATAPAEVNETLDDIERATKHDPQPEGDETP